MRSSGFEPPRYCYRQPLKLVRLPVPPRPHRGKDYIVAALNKGGKTREIATSSQEPQVPVWTTAVSQAQSTAGLLEPA